jgi:hypothetical protein
MYALCTMYVSMYVCIYVCVGGWEDGRIRAFVLISISFYMSVWNEQNLVQHHLKNKCQVKSKSLQSVRLGVDLHLRLMTRYQTVSLPTAVTEDRGQVCLSVTCSASRSSYNRGKGQLLKYLQFSLRRPR